MFQSCFGRAKSVDRQPKFNHSSGSSMPEQQPASSSASLSGAPLMGGSSSTTTTGSLGAVPSTAACVFCDVSLEKGFRIFYEDENYTVFRDRSPGSKVHTLAVPKRHIENVKTLTSADMDVVRGLEAVTRKVLDDMGVARKDQRMGFHIPPFYSIKHLHLHGLSMPLPFPGNYKYCPAPVKPSKSTSVPPGKKEKVKGLSWFITVDQVLKILEVDGKVKVGSVYIPGGGRRPSATGPETREA